MRGMQATGSEAFRRGMAPTIDAVHDLADAVGERAERHGHQPSASSRAMEEIAVEATFAKTVRRLAGGACAASPSGRRRRVPRPWKARAAALGWTANVSSNKPVIDGTSRPSVPKGLSELLVDDGEARIGRHSGAISRPSRTSLGTASAKLCRARRRPASFLVRFRMGQPRRPCGRRPCACSGRFARLPMLGSSSWGGPTDWRAASARAEQHEITLMQAYQQGNA
jgi:hypothetical protein